MKLFWKLLAAFTGLTLVSFASFGTVLLQSSFRTLLAKETENGQQEVQTLWYAFLAAEEGVEENYTVNERIVRQLAQSVVSNVGDTQTESAVYNADGESVYPKGRSISGLYSWFQEHTAQSGSGVWRLTERDGRHCMESLVQMECGEQIYYLEVCRDIEYVYASRETGFRTYRTVFGALFVLALAVSVFFSSRFTAPIRRLSETTREFAAGCYALRTEPSGQDEIAGLMRDFNQMADKLEAAMEELREHVKRQEEFTGAFAHELKTPLTAMIGYSELLLTTEIDETERRLSEEYIYHESRRLERLAEKMLELIRIGRLGAECTRVSAQAVEAHLRQLFAGRMEEKELAFSCGLEDGTICGDFDLLVTFLANLVDNSRKACAPGGWIRVQGRALEAAYEITVEDNGCGMTKEETARVREAFYMADKSRARREGGAGLGLAICEKIAAAHAAEWHIESRAGEGTRVTVRFPETGAEGGRDA